MPFLKLIPVERPASVVPKHLSSPTLIPTRTSTPTDNSNASADANGTGGEKPVVRNDNDSATPLAAEAEDAVVTRTNDNTAPGCAFLQLTPDANETGDSAEVPGQAPTQV